MLAMTDRELAIALRQARDLERTVKAQLQTEDLAERDQALNVLRLVKPLARQLETWISVRALKAQLAHAR